MPDEGVNAPSAGFSAIAGLAASVIFCAWLFHMHASDGGDKSFIGFLIIPLALTALALGAPLAIAFHTATLVHRAKGWQKRWPILGFSLSSSLALVLMAWVFGMVLPDYLSPPYERYKASRDAQRDFSTPWGARMMAVAYGRPSDVQSLLAGRTLWVAETEMTRLQYASLMGTPPSPESALPVTGLDARQIEVLIEKANRLSTGAPRGGRFRLPSNYEAQAYSGDWWITGYPKQIYRCDENLSPAHEVSSNGLALRGTTANAAELVLSQDHSNGPFRYCAMLGTLPWHCGTGPNPDQRGSFKPVRYGHCSGREPERVLRDPGVGLRLVYSLDDPAFP